MRTIKRAGSLLALTLPVATILWAAGRPAAAGATEARPARQVVLWHLSPADGASIEQVRRMEALIRRTFERDHAAEILDLATMDSLLLVEGNEKFLRCGVATGCLAELGLLVGARSVIAGEVGFKDGQTRVRLVRVLVADRAQAGAAQVRSTGEFREEQLEELRVAMFQPERYLGSLELTSDVDGAEVLLDGERVGLTPLIGPLARLPAGEHLLEVWKDGHQAFRRQVHIPMGRMATVVAVLPLSASARQIGPPFWADWPFWSCLAVGLAGVATGGALVADAQVLEDNADVRRARNLEYLETQGRADDRAMQAYILFGVGGAGLLAAGIIAIVDAVGGQPSASGARPHLRPAPEGVGLGWSF
jgi:hypothetical protein